MAKTSHRNEYYRNYQPPGHLSAQIQTRVSHSQRDALNAAARERGISRDALVRELIAPVIAPYIREA